MITDTTMMAAGAGVVMKNDKRLHYLITGTSIEYLNMIDVLYLGCSVDGNLGDGTAQGDCAYNTQVCHYDGICKGTLC